MHRSAQLVLLFLVAFLVPALAGCGKKSSTTPAPVVANAQPEPAQPAEPATPATPSDEQLNALFSRTLDFLDQFATAIASNEADCKKMAAAMTGVFDDNKALLDEAKSLSGNKEVDAKADAYMEQNKARFDAAMQKMTPGMQACGADPDVQKAMEGFDAM